MNEKMGKFDNIENLNLCLQYHKEGGKTSPNQENKHKANKD